MFNVCPTQESEGASCNKIAPVVIGDEILHLELNDGWYLLDLTGTVFLDDTGITDGTGFDLYIDRKLKCSLPMGTYNTKLILQVHSTVTIIVSKNMDDSELAQATFTVVATRIKPICCTV